MLDQLKLPLPLPRAKRDAAPEFIHTTANDAALTWLDRVTEWPHGRLALWGEAGCGKTHLLHRWAAATGAHYVTGATLPRLDELPDLPGIAGFAIDDADAMAGAGADAGADTGAGAGADEATLLHLLNATAEARLPVLLAASIPPARWPVRLPDLASRLRAITAVELPPPDDDLLRTLLARLFADRQHAVSVPTQDWLLARLPRTPAALREAVDRLNRAALGSSGGINRALARAELADLIDPDCDAPGSDNHDAGWEDVDRDTAPPGTHIAETTSSSALPSPPTLPLL